jgi:hypothetical protein
MYLLIHARLADAWAVERILLICGIQEFINLMSGAPTKLNIPATEVTAL